MNILEKFTAISTIIMDMDGVLTDGSLGIMPDDEWVRRMHIRDGYALQLAVKKGFHVIVISGSSSLPVERRLNKLGINRVYQQVKDKAAVFGMLLEELHVTRAETLYIGDDVPDLTVMQMAGISCCPADACRDILEIADYISPVKGGEGCVRDILEKMMRVQGKWSQDPELPST